MAKPTKKPSGALKALVNAGKQETRALSAVERWVLSQPEDTSRRMDVIHPSAIIKQDWCHRAQYYLLMGESPAPKLLTRRQKAVFQIGHDVHARWQGLFGEMGVLHGVWECDYCEARAWGTSPKSCACGGSVFAYNEVPVLDKDLRIAGHADGWLQGLGEDILLEIKSVGDGTIRWEDPGLWYDSDQDFNKAWANIKAPFYSHIMQTQVYLHVLEKTFGDAAPKEVLFIYENKLNQDVKEFVIPKSNFGITHIMDAVAMIVQCAEDGTPPTCNVNSAGSCKQCEVFNVN